MVLVSVLLLVQAVLMVNDGGGVDGVGGLGFMTKCGIESVLYPRNQQKAQFSHFNNCDSFLKRLDPNMTSIMKMLYVTHDLL